MNFDPDTALEELDIFRSSSGKDLPQVLEDYLVAVAKNGNTVFPWNKMKPVLKCKIEQVLDEFCKTCPTDSIPSLPNTDAFNFDGLKNNILEALDSFESAPFTIQRVCELITNPRKHYSRTDKYMRGLEKNLLVVSTVQPKSNDQDSDQDQIVKSQPAMVNGVCCSDTVNSIDGHGYENCVTDEAPPVNGTVLENFATVFPSAPHITNPPSSIQVAIVSGSDSYQSAQNMSTFTYCTDNSDEGFHDAPESAMTYETDTATYCDPESEEKYIVIEELNGQEADEEDVAAAVTGNSFPDGGNATSFSDEEQCPVSSNDSMSSSEGVDDGGEEPERKRRKISIDSSEMVIENGVALDDAHAIHMDDAHVAAEVHQHSTNDFTNVPGSEVGEEELVAMSESSSEADEVKESE